ncbi:hypothetical protein AtNW77_Chr5g0113901 [Arabidopsis thaliana]
MPAHGGVVGYGDVVDIPDGVSVDVPGTIVPDYGNVDNVEGMRGRRSKRLCTLSSKLDGRFQYDKKTKLLVGHPSPVINQVNVDLRSDS